MQNMSGIFISEEIGYDKPSKEFFSYVLSHIDEKDKSKILVVGDSLYSDIAGAVNCSIDSCWINNGKWQESGAKYVIKSVRELKTVLNT